MGWVCAIYMTAHENCRWRRLRHDLGPVPLEVSGTWMHVSRSMLIRFWASMVNWMVMGPRSGGARLIWKVLGTSGLSAGPLTCTHRSTTLGTTGTVVGAFFTFVLYGVAPVSLVLYLMGTPGRKRAIKAREAAELAKAAAAASDQPDTGGEAAADAVAPVRKEP